MRCAAPLVAVVASACIPPKSTPMTWPALDAQLLADSAATFNFKLGVPAPLAVTADGAVLFRRTPAREFVADLYELDTSTGAVKTLVSVAELLGTGDEHLSDAEKARRERARVATRGVVDIDVSRDGRFVLVPLGGTFYLVDRKAGTRRIVDPGGAAYDPHLSPDGGTIAFVRDGDLWTVAPGAAARRITQHPEGLEYGVAEFAAQEELGRRRGFWWSPDGASIVFQRTDARAVDTIYVADPRHPERAPVPFKYPRAGTTNAAVDLGVIAAGGGEPRWLTWDTLAFPYLARVAWAPNAALSIVVLSREQNDLAVISFDPEGRSESGPLPLGPAGKSRTVFTEHDDAWINLAAGGGLGRDGGVPLWLPDGSGLLWMTESRGAWTLELRSPDGAVVRALTTPELGLRALIGLDGGAAIVEASSDPTRQDVWRIPLDGSPATRVIDADGVTDAAFDHGVVVAITRLHTGGKRAVAIRGTAHHELPSVAEQPTLVPTTAIETVELGGRTHYVAVTRPRGFDPHRRYPVVLKVYAGPHLAMVDAARDSYVMDQWYADAGFVVVRSDGRGTPNRGRAWERAVAEDLITVALDDQVGALQAIAARHPEMDMTRVGVAGWSFGGYFATLAVLLRPDVFHAAVAGAPVTDWQLYDTAYTERYMRTPQHNPDGYKRASALTHAAQLSRPLLIIHGITDDNVHFAHTLALIEALYVAGKRAEVITLSATHMVPDPKLSFAREQVQIDFFRQHLGGR
jgi:dipeptidyl-peptidase-4